MWLHQALDLVMLPTLRTGVGTTAAPDFITGPIMGMGVITDRGMAAQAIGMTARGVSTVHEVAPPTGMMGPEVPVDIAAVQRTGAAAQEVRPDGVAAPHPGVADRARFTELEVAPARGGVKHQRLSSARVSASTVE
jgi:hypothetical protein